MPLRQHESMNRLRSDANASDGYPITVDPADQPANGRPSQPRTVALTRRVDGRALAVAGVLTFVVLFNSLTAARAQAEVTTAAQAAVTVTGTGVAYGTPDVAVLEVGVTVFGADVRTALAEADTRMSAVREAVIAAGVTAEDIRTTNLNVWRDERTNQDGDIVIDRYQVSHSYQVQVRDVDKVGEVLAAAVDAGANSIGGITFTIADPKALATEARALAMADAVSTAGELAELAGVSLGAVTAISELGYGPIGAYAAAARFDMAAMSSVEAGQLAVSVTISVVYAID